ncbi:alkaline phosphatase [Hydrogenispora ethanolica]|uniref:Alkaline phosphatase n=2 Tax=Hydrogenispora ethanolica TaxID=1082276 RepID=A0A4R1SBL2_HYDET|nr:alkaline phosphatase [Hydrogenispora ethanolica]
MLSNSLKTRIALTAMVLTLMLTMLLSGGAAFAAQLPNFPYHSIDVLPIDRAKFLAGQKIDFEVELKDLGTIKSVEVLINYNPAEKFFGKAPVVKLAAGVSSYRIDQVSFAKPGPVNVIVNVLTEQGAASREVNYTVVADKAQKLAKNVILFVGDGMSLQARQMARILSKGLTEGKYHDLLEMEKMSNLALVTTSGMDSLVTDSANSASAYATGSKSAVNAMGIYPNSTGDPLDDPKVENIIELAKRSRGMATGIVSTANITDATPAAMVAHTRRRSEQNFIAASMLDPEHRPDVILGGGSQHFLPKSVPGSKRSDDRNLVEEFKSQGYTFAGNKTELNQIQNSAKVLGLFQLDNMNVYIDREVTKNPAVLGSFTDQPTLMDMTKQAINVLSKNQNGFFLMVEGACIDKQLHTVDWERATYDTIEMDKAIGIAKEFAKKNNDTLIIVVADHAHSASITGTYHELDGKTGRQAVRTYAEAGFPTFEDKNKDGFPDNPAPAVTLAIQYANHPEYYEDYKFNPEPIAPAIKSGSKTIANPKKDANGDLNSSKLPDTETQEVHTADDVPLTADGPGAEYFRGIMDNTEVFFGMVRALGLDAVK